MTGTSSFAHIALPVADPERSARFYADLLEMTILSSSPEAAFLSTAGERDLMAFSRSDAPVASSRATMHFGFVVDPPVFDRALATIERLSIKKVSEPGERMIGRFIFVEDPDGYTVEIFEHDKTAW